MNRYTIPLPEALQLAAKRQAERLAGIQADLDDLTEAGCTLTITAVQLLRLENAGLLYDFETGLVEDFAQAPDNPRRGLSVAEITERLAQLPTAPGRQQFYTQVVQTLPVQNTELRELTQEMMAGL